MAKLTPEQKITKLEDAIAKEELAIEESKDKIKNMKAELKRLQSEQEQSFASGMLKLMKENGISQKQMLEMMKAARITSMQSEPASDEETAETAQGISSPSATTFSSPNYTAFHNIADNES